MSASSHKNVIFVNRGLIGLGTGVVISSTSYPFISELLINDVNDLLAHICLFRN